MNKIKEDIWGLIDNIFNDLTDCEFDPEGYYQILLKEFRHLSLFSVCLHFLRCQRSCEKHYGGYCRLCLPVRDNNFFEANTFLSAKVSDMDGYLGTSYSETVDFDVFLTQPGYFSYAFCESNCRCNQHEVFSYTHDLFAASCSVLIRMYLNIAMKVFSTLISSTGLADEKKLIAKILTGAKILLFRFFDLNYDFCYEFFDLFSEVNGRDYYVMFLNKPKYGPCSGRKYSVQIIAF